MPETDKAALALHGDAIVIDGLIIAQWAKWERQVFEDMRRGGLSAANRTCAMWEGFTDTMDNIRRAKRQARGTWLVRGSGAQSRG